MGEILSGAPVAQALNERIAEKTERLRGLGIETELAIVRLGERADDLSYERTVCKRSEKVGIRVRSVVLPSDVEEEVFYETLKKLNEDPSVHGIMMFRPLPHQISDEKARRLLDPAKDVDGCTDASLAGVFTNTKKGFAPCTAQAAMEVLKYYQIPLKGKKATVIGRSLVVGRPVAMMLMHENATVTICHTRTEDVASEARAADILIAASGAQESVDASFVHEGQVVIDVGIGWSETKQKLVGDVEQESVQPIVAAMTPVPGGVGSVTTGVLLLHTAQAAELAAGLR